MAKRPRNHVLVDYNQNAWGRTLASVYSVRPTPRATVSTPVSWDEISRGLKIEDFRIDNILPRLCQIGDLWAPLFDPVRRVDLQPFLKPRAQEGTMTLGLKVRTSNAGVMELLESGTGDQQLRPL